MPSGFSTMVENLLSVTRIQDEKGAATVVKAEESLEEVISSAVERFRKRFPDVQVRVSIPEIFIIVRHGPHPHRAGNQQSSGKCHTSIPEANGTH